MIEIPVMLICEIEDIIPCVKKTQLVVCFLLGNSPESEFYMPTFWNTVCSIFIGRQVYTYQPMKVEHTECSETSAYKIQMPGNYPEENIQHTEHGESLKSRKTNLMHDLFLVHFVNLYMFRAYLGPSSGGTTVCIQQLVFFLNGCLLSCLDWNLGVDEMY